MSSNPRAAMKEGGCFCRFVRYQAQGVPRDETNCHCSICRRVNGATPVAWFTVPSAAFRFVAGQPSSFASSDHGTRTFCPRCGTPLTFRSTRFPDDVDITVCSLDAPAAVPPKDHTQTSAKLAWVSITDGLPVFPAARG